MANLKTAKGREPRGRESHQAATEAVRERLSRLQIPETRGR